MVKCPHYDCSDSDKEFESESTMRQHHTKVHNKRLPNCECENCDELFYHKSGTRSYCDECKDEINKGENNPNYSGGKKKTQCRECSSEFEYYESEKEGIFCSDCVENGSNVKTSTRFGFENGIKPSVAGRISSKSYSNKKSKVKRNKKTRGGVKTELYCSICGVKYNEYVWRLRSRQPENPVCSRNCLDKLNSDRMRGENNPRWSGGVDWNRKYSVKWKKVRQKVYKRDNGRCQICGENESNLPVIHGHHIIPVSEFENEDDAHYKENAILVCPSCHPKLEQDKISIPESVVNEKNLESK